MRVRMLRAAREELSEAVRHYEAAREGLGEEFLEEFARAVDRIRAWPLASQTVSTYSRRQRLDRFPYGAVYQLDESEIVILAVMFLRRKPGYWMERERRF